MGFQLYRILNRIVFLILLIAFMDILIEANDLHVLQNSTNGSAGEDSNGYTDIILFKEKFIAIGTDGRIDKITKSGEATPLLMKNQKLNCAYINDKTIIIVGNNGTILSSEDGNNFFESESGIDKNINGITGEKDLLVACADDGIILSSTDGKVWKVLQTNVKGNIISISSNKTLFVGITDSGEVILSKNGIDWDVRNINKEYEGYYQISKFKKILAVEHSIIIIGTHEDDSPSIMMSSLGNVWSERIPYYISEQGVDCFLENEPNDVTYDPVRDQFILACDNGVLFTLPACNKCNEYLKISEYDLNAIIYNDNYLWIVGAEFSVFKQD